MSLQLKNLINIQRGKRGQRRNEDIAKMRKKDDMGKGKRRGIGYEKKGGKGKGDSDGKKCEG